MSAEPRRPKHVAHHALVRLRVTGGFLAGCDLEFADGLNCFIGGRGAGKTSALEFLRFGLGLMPDQKTHPQRHKVLDGLVKANLGAGRVSIELRTKTNMLYTAGRAANESVQVVNEQGVAVPITLDRDLIFSADVFSQNEIEDIASSAGAQLWLLDRFQEERSSAVAREIEQLERQLEHSSEELRRLDEECDDLRNKASELPAIEEKLKGLAEVGGPDADKINAAHGAKALRAREEKVTASLIDAVQKVAREVGVSLSGLQTATEAQLDEGIRSGPNGELFRETLADVRVFEDAVMNVARQLGEAAAATHQKLIARQQALAALHAVQEAAYRELVSQTEQQGGRAAERTAWQASHASALAAQKNQQAREKQRENRRGERVRLLATLSELRDRRFELRKTVADRLSRQFEKLRVTITQAADSDLYRQLLVDNLKNSGVKPGPTADRLAEVCLPTALARMVADSDLTELQKRTGFDEDKSRKILTALRAGRVAYNLECVDLPDRPCVELLDGQVFKPSNRLSTGQRCTTILPILLLQSERPLLIDQPEDNLDNAFVFDTIVKALQELRHPLI